MDIELINGIKDIGDKDKTIELLQEGVNILLSEIDPLILKLKRVNKDCCIDILQSQAEFLTDIFAFATKILTKNSTTPVTAEQGLLIVSLNSLLEKSSEKIIEIK